MTNDYKKELKARTKELEDQELGGVAVTLDQMLSKELQEKWGLEQLEHPRNIQHIFMRACVAIQELEDACKKQSNLLEIFSKEPCDDLTTFDVVEMAGRDHLFQVEQDVAIKFLRKENRQLKTKLHSVQEIVRGC